MGEINSSSDKPVDPSLLSTISKSSAEPKTDLENSLGKVVISFDEMSLAVFGDTKTDPPTPPYITEDNFLSNPKAKKFLANWKIALSTLNNDSTLKETAINNKSIKNLISNFDKLSNNPLLNKDDFSDFKAQLTKSQGDLTTSFEKNFNRDKSPASDYDPVQWNSFLTEMENINKLPGPAEVEFIPTQVELIPTEPTTVDFVAPSTPVQLDPAYMGKNIKDTSNTIRTTFEDYKNAFAEINNSFDNYALAKNAGDQDAMKTYLNEIKTKIEDFKAKDNPIDKEHPIPLTVITASGIDPSKFAEKINTFKNILVENKNNVDISDFLKNNSINLEKSDTDPSGYNLRPLNDMMQSIVYAKHYLDYAEGYIDEDSPMGTSSSNFDNFKTTMNNTFTSTAPSIDIEKVTTRMDVLQKGLVDDVKNLDRNAVLNKFKDSDGYAYSKATNFLNILCKSGQPNDSLGGTASSDGQFFTKLNEYLTLSNEVPHLPKYNESNPNDIADKASNLYDWARSLETEDSSGTDLYDDLLNSVNRLKY